MKFTANETGGNFSETAYGSTSLTTSYSAKLSTSYAFFAQYKFNLFQLQRGNKNYELTNYTSIFLSTGLGNVLAVITDKRLLSCMGDTIQSSFANIVSATDYSPFGAPLAGRTFQASEYRFAFNGQEKDDEISGAGNTMTAEFWEYDARLGRRWNLDPILMDDMSLYSVLLNCPIFMLDPQGDEPTPDGKPIEKEQAPRWLVSTEKFKTTVYGDGSGDVIVSAPRNAKIPEVITASNLPKEVKNESNSDADVLNNFAMGFTPAGIALDLYTLRTGKEYGSDNPVTGFYRYAGVIPLVSEFRKIKTVLSVKKALPVLDETGKVHGILPKVVDFGKYSNDELEILLKELKQSVQKRIEVTSILGRDRAHGQRQGAEQDLIKQLEKYLNK